MESAALLGLTEAACRFDASRKEPFMAFAAKRIRGAILDHLRQNDVLSRRVRCEVRLVAKATWELEKKLGRPATDSEIAAAMGVDEAKFHQDEGDRRIAVIHLDELGGELADVVTTCAEVCESQRRRASLMQALRVLDDRMRMILSYYYREGLGLREIGTILGVTESRVCQLHSQALSLLRGLLS